MPRIAASTRVKSKLLSSRAWGLILISVVALGIAIYAFAGPPPTKPAITRSIPHALTQEERETQRDQLAKQAEADARAKSEQDKSEIDAIYEQTLEQLEAEHTAAAAASQKAHESQKRAEAQAKAAAESGEVAAREQADKEAQAAKELADAHAAIVASLEARKQHLASERNISIALVEQTYSLEALSGFGSVVDAALLKLEAGIISKGAQTVLDDFCMNTEPFPLDMQKDNHVDLDQVWFSVLDARRSSMYFGNHECVGLAEAGQEPIAPQAYMLEDSATAMQIGEQALFSLNSSLPALKGMALDRASFMATSNGSSYPCCSRVVLAVHPVFGVFYRTLVPVKHSTETNAAEAVVPVCFRRRWWPLPDSQAVNPVTARILPYVTTDNRSSLSTQQIAEAAAVGAGTERLPFTRPTLSMQGLPVEAAATDSRRVLVVVVADGLMLHLLPGVLRSVTRSARESLRHVSLVITMTSLDNPSLTDTEVRSRVTKLAEAVHAHTGADIEVVFPFAATPYTATIDELEGELFQTQTLIKDWASRLNLPFGRSSAARDLAARSPAARGLEDGGQEQQDPHVSIIACRPMLAVLQAMARKQDLASTTRVVVLDSLVTRISPSLIHEAVNYVSPGHTVWSPIPSTLMPGEEDEPRTAGIGGWDGVAENQDPTGDIQALNSTHAYTTEQFWSVGMLDEDLVTQQHSPGAGDDAAARARRLRSLTANNSKTDDADDDGDENEVSAETEADIHELGDHATGFGIDTLPNSHATYIFSKADLALAIMAADTLGIHSGDMCDSESVGRALLVGAESAGLRVMRVSSLPLLMASDMHGEDGALCPDGPVFHNPNAAYCGRAWSRSTAEYASDASRVKCGLAQILHDTTLVDFHQVRVPAEGGESKRRQTTLAEGGESKRRQTTLAEGVEAHSVTSLLDPASGYWMAASLHTDKQEANEARFEFLFPLSQEAWSCTTCGAQ